MRNKLILTVVIIAISTALFAEEQRQNKSSNSEFIWKVGAGHASYPDRFGLDMSFNYMYNPDPIFAFGFEGDFLWINWTEEKVDEVTEKTRKTKKELYTFPFFINGQIRLPFLRDIIYVEPAVTMGLGVACMFGDKGPHGTFPALQGLGTLYFNPFKNSAADFALDFGYRYMPLSNGDRNMSGFVARFGVKVAL